MRYAILLLCLAVLAGCETVYYGHPQPGPPAHAPAHGYHKKHVYYYYPDVEVYWSVGLGTYAVFGSDGWVVVSERPAVLGPSHRYVILELDHKEPWRQHSHYKKKYPPGQAKKHARGKGKWK
jgi:hypothetical protein